MLDRLRLGLALAPYAAALLGSSACLDVPGAPAKDALSVRDVTAPEGTKLETACTPGGVEVCFDARDNNCNGVIDEGCGLHTGVLQFVIAWESTDADIDLNVYDPTGELARLGEATSAGLMKDRDCPRSEECHGQNVENVYLSEGEPRAGRYRAVIRLDKLNGASPPIKVRLGARVGQRGYAMTVDLAPGPGTEEKTFEFTL